MPPRGFAVKKLSIAGFERADGDIYNGHIEPETQIQGGNLHGPRQVRRWPAGKRRVRA